MDQTNFGDRVQRLTRWFAPPQTVGVRAVSTCAACLAIVAASWSPSALADAIPGAKPGDEALSCQQIYAEGMAETQRERDARDQKTDAMKLQQKSFIGQLGAAMATGGLVGGQAVQKSGEDMLASQGRIADTANQPNPRKDRLRQLWSEKRCAGTGGAKPPDEAMTCEQIAAEMAPYAQQIAPSAQSLATTQQQLNEQGIARGEKQRAESAALSSLATAGALDPTGASKRAYQAAVIGLQQKHNAENQAFANSPQAKQAEAQRQQFMAQGQQLQGDERLQQLMRLGQQKGCDRR
jgi:hypothetical protein